MICCAKKTCIIILCVALSNTAISQYDEQRRKFDSAAYEIMKDFWQVVSSNDQSKFYMNYRYMDYQYPNDTVFVKAWVKTDKKTYKYNGKTYTNPSFKEIVYFNCKEKKYKTTSWYFYDSKGEIIDSRKEDGYEEWNEAVPGSLGENMVKNGCALIRDKERFHKKGTKN